MRLGSVLIAFLLSFTFACKSGDHGSSDSGVTETGGPSTDSGDTDMDTDTGTSGDCVVVGDLDFGSGGGSSGVTTYPVTVTNDIIAHPFTVIEGAYYGKVSIAPTSSPFPDDGTGVRVWWSETAGGQPLAGDFCSARLGREGTMFWDQSGTRGYGCEIDNTASTLHLNLQACISASDDTTCGAAGAEAGSPAPIYIQGQLAEVE